MIEIRWILDIVCQTKCRKEKEGTILIISKVRWFRKKVDELCLNSFPLRFSVTFYTIYSSFTPDKIY
jgi:hypothetical protein